MTSFLEILNDRKQRDTRRVSLVVPDDVVEVPDLVWDLSPVELSLQGNFSGLAPGIERCSELRSLTLNSGGLADLPDEIGQLHRLETLEVEAGEMTELNKAVGELKALKSFLLYGTKLTRLPDEIVQLVNLWHFELHDTAMTHMPPQICELTQLTALSLRHNAFEQLPPNFTRLENLRYLDLTGNLLQTIPKLSALSRLSELLLCDNPLVSVDPSIGELPDLGTFSIDEDAQGLLPPRFWDTKESNRRLS